MIARVRIVNCTRCGLIWRRGVGDARHLALCDWEWLLQGVVLQLGFPLDAAYKPLHDAWAERLMLEARSRFGARLIPAKELLADFLGGAAAPWWARSP